VKGPLTTNTRKTSKNTYSLFAGLLNHYIVSKYKPLLPRVLVFAVTYLCNSRCMMCNIWKKGNVSELTAEQYHKLFGNRLFRCIEHVNLTGGEPTLRKDLSQIVADLHQQMPRLRKITIPTNGLAARSVRVLEEIVSFCNAVGLTVTIRVSLDGMGRIHDRIRNVKDAYQKTVESIDAFISMKQHYVFNLGINTVVSRENINGLLDIKNFAEEKELDISFVLPCFTETFFENISLENEISMKNEQKAIFIRFLEDEIGKIPLLDSNRVYYDQIIKKLRDNAQRIMPCPFTEQGIMVDAAGDIYYCQNSKRLGNALEISASQIYLDKNNLAYRNDVIRNVCPGCMNSCMVGFGLRTQIPQFIWHLVKSKFGARRTIGQDSRTIRIRQD
jgi:MoaA/NifB/PqqE/SkfB family radical SAM enzyme